MANEKMVPFKGVGATDFAPVGVELAQSLLTPDMSKAGKGKAIGSTVGTVAGAYFGPVGMAVGSALGSLVGGAIGGGQDKRIASNKMHDIMDKKYGALDVAYNANPYGDGSTFYAEDGLALPDANGQIQVNIEKGELQVDPATFDILGDFRTRRYKPHAREKSNENPGNFITMDASHVIIPKKKAEAFKQGDRISRRSIIAQIMQEQDENGVQTNNTQPYAKDGFAGDPKPQGQNFVVAELGDANAMPSKYMVDIRSRHSVQGTDGKPVYMYNSTDANGKQTVLEESKIAKFLGHNNNAAVTTVGANGKTTGIDSFYSPSGDMPWGLHLPQGKVPKAENGYVGDPLDLSRPLNTGIDYTFGIPSASRSNRVNKLAPQANQIPVNDLTVKIPNKPISGVAAIEKTDLIDPLHPDKLSKPFLGNLNAVDAARIASTIPTVVGLGQAMQNDPFLQYTENNQFDNAKSYVQQMPVDENLEPVKAAAARTQAAYRQQMRNVSSPSTRAEVSDMIAKTNADTANVVAEAGNRRLQRIGQKLGLLSNLETQQGADRKESRVRFATESSQDRAVRQGMVQAGASELATNYGKSVMDKERIKAVNSMLKFNTITPGAEHSVTENQDALNNAIAIIASYTGSGMLPQPAKTGKAAVTTKTDQRYDKRNMPAGSTRSQSVTTRE